MIKKLEAWFRSIIAQEVSTIEGKLTAERDRVVSFISVHTRAATIELEIEVKKLIAEFETKVRTDVGFIVAEKNQIITELQDKLEALQTTVAKISHWKADSDTAAQDHSLKLVK